MGRWTQKYRHGRTLEGGALTALTLTKRKDFDWFPLPLLVALGFEHLVNIVANSLCLFFGPETLFSVSGRRTAAVMGSESEWHLFAGSMQRMNVAEGLESGRQYLLSP